MALKIAIEVSGNWQKGLAVLKELKSKACVKAMDRSLADTSERAAEQLRENIRRGTVQKLSGGTLLKRAYGKRKGKVWPAIPAYESKRPLFRSGALANAITAAKIGDLHHKVGVEPKMGAFSGGTYLNLPAIAAAMETGYTATVPITHRMQAYLHILLGGKSSRQRWHMPEGFTGRTLTVRVPARPLWAQTWGGFEKQFDRSIPRAFFEALPLAGHAFRT
jgi:hypothetical protein